MTRAERWTWMLGALRAMADVRKEVSGMHANLKCDIVELFIRRAEPSNVAVPPGWTIKRDVGKKSYTVTAPNGYTVKAQSCVMGNDPRTILYMLLKDMHDPRKNKTPKGEAPP